MSISSKLSSKLSRIERRITNCEGAGLLARWEFGRELLKQRVGKTLPHGLLNKICETIRVSRQEVGARMKFAEKYEDEEKLSNAVRKFKTWHEMVKEGLTTKKRDRHIPEFDVFDEAGEILEWLVQRREKWPETLRIGFAECVRRQLDCMEIDDATGRDWAKGSESCEDSPNTRRIELVA